MAYSSQTLNRTADQLIVLPLPDQQIDWEQNLIDFPIDGEQGAAWLFDQDAQSIVGALFDPQFWTEDGARVWLTDAAARLSQVVAALAANPVPATVHYLRKLIELLREHVSDAEFQAAVQVARAHAGGKLKGRSQPVEGEPDEEGQKETAQRSMTRFAVATAPSATQPYLDATGYIWKPILRAATVYNWRGEPLTITPEILAALVASFGKCGIEHVDIPLGHNEDRWGDAPELNTGFVRALELRDGGKTLWAALDFTDDAIKQKVLDGSIANVSVWIECDFRDLNVPDKVWAWVLWHVALTNKPQMTGLAPFGRRGQARIYRAGQGRLGSRGGQARATLYQEGQFMAFQTGDTVRAADGTAGTILEVQEGTFYLLVDSANQDVRLGWYPEADLTAGDGADTDAGEMSAAQVAAFARRLGLAPQEIRTFKQEREHLRTKSRKQEIGAVVAALEGRGAHELVQQIDGTQHHPVVVAAVEQALREQPAKLSLTAGLDGTVPGLDAALLAVVNAIPKEGRLSLAQPKVRRRDANEDDGAAVKQDEIKDLDKELRGA